MFLQLVISQSTANHCRLARSGVDDLTHRYIITMEDVVFLSDSPFQCCWNPT